MPAKLTPEQANARLQQLREIARGHGGQCESQQYVGWNRPHQFLCKAGHKWASSAAKIFAGTWCRKCTMQRIAHNSRVRIEVLQKEAESRGGELGSTEYESAGRRVRWRCGHGHEWWARWNDVRRGNWCPECSSSFGERVCRAYFETLFGGPFPKVKNLEWLRSEKGRFLELDGYNEELKLDFEHQGGQHYGEGHGFYRASSAGVQARDATKRKLCFANGVTVIEVPEIGGRIKLNDARSAIVELCQIAGIPVREDWMHIEIDLRAAYLPQQTDLLKRLQGLAENFNGQLLSETFLGWFDSHEWKCADPAHPSFLARPSNVLAGKWCRRCGIERTANNQRDSIATFQKIAVRHEGECLSTDYTNQRSRLTFRCRVGHVFTAMAVSVKRGSWCLKCQRARAGVARRDSLQTYTQIAQERGGFCLSKEYLNAHGKLEFQCAAGHKFTATARRVKYHGAWCRKCVPSQPRPVGAVRGSNQKRAPKTSSSAQF